MRLNIKSFWLLWIRLSICYKKTYNIRYKNVNFRLTKSFYNSELVFEKKNYKIGIISNYKGACCDENITEFRTHCLSKDGN